MARTLLGILQFRTEQDVTKTEPKITAALNKIEREANHLGSAKWGVGFQRQLDRLKVSPTEQAAIVRSYDRLARGINGKVAKADFSAWRGGVISNLTAVRSEIDATRKRADQLHASFLGKGSPAAGFAKSAIVALGAYTLWYGAGMAMRQGFLAGGERQREFFRQKMAGIPEAEREQILDKSQELTLKYASVGLTEIMEMARTARNTMGNTKDGLAILEALTRGLVTLQSSQGTDAAADSMLRLIRGLDNMGINSGGEVGIEAMKEIIAGAIRAAQIEGSEIDVGKYFEFARRSKVAGPALSNEFLATTAPVLMQDMTAPTAGNSVAMFFKAFIVGAKDTASKVNIEAQQALGIRTESGLVDAQLAGENPYEWTKKYLIPALQKAGVDLNNEVAVAKAIADLTRNFNAAGLLTRMVTQSAQIERLIGMYGQAMGPDAADFARDEDPFVSAKGFTTSLGNLASSFGEHLFPVIVPGINALSDGINVLAQSIRNADGMSLALTGLAGALGLYGAGKLAKGVLGKASLNLAGVSLQKAAVDLSLAAANLNGQGGLGNATGKSGSGAKAGFLAGALGVAAKWGVAVGPALLSEGLTNSPLSMDDYNAQVAQQGQNKQDLQKFFGGIGDFFYKEPTASTSQSSEFDDLRAVGLKTTLSEAVEKQDELRKPVDLSINTSVLDATIAKMERVLMLKNAIGAAGSSYADQAQSTFSDAGVAVP